MTGVGCTNAQVLAINGCAGATQDIWGGLHAAGAATLALQSLSAVGCKKLRSCWLGLQPASPADADTQQRLLSANMYSPPSSSDTAWTQVPVSVSGERLSSAAHPFLSASQICPSEFKRENPFTVHRKE